MDNIVQKFKNTFYTKEFVTFLIIGVINTFNGTVFSYIYSSFLNENIAFIVGYISRFNYILFIEQSYNF